MAGGEVDSRALAAAREFAGDFPAERLQPVGGGLINDSWWLPGSGDGLLLQRLNSEVFARPRQVMENIARVTAHQGARSRSRRHRLTLVPTLGGEPWWVDPDGAWWRCFEYIAGTRTVEQVRDSDIAHAAGRAFGGFVADMAELPGPPLHETIPGFHDTPARIEALERSVRQDPLGRAADVVAELAAVRRQRGLVERFTALLADGDMPRRVVHSDTKVDNLLFDADSGEALCVVDLDTVMPGWAAHDFGDLARNVLASPSGNGVDLALFDAITRGFVDATGAMLVPAERAALAPAASILALELGARFLTDHLLGDRYFKTDHPGQNLERCRRQLALLDAMEGRRAEMEALVAEALATVNR